MAADRHRSTDFWGQLATFARLAMPYVLIAVLLDFFVKHYIFRWRTAMNAYYMAHSSIWCTAGPRSWS